MRIALLWGLLSCAVALAAVADERLPKMEMIDCATAPLASSFPDDAPSCFYNLETTERGGKIDHYTMLATHDPYFAVVGRSVARQGTTIKLATIQQMKEIELADQRLPRDKVLEWFEPGQDGDLQFIGYRKSDVICYDFLRGLERFGPGYKSTIGGEICKVRGESFPVGDFKALAAHFSQR